MKWHSLRDGLGIAEKLFLKKGRLEVSATGCIALECADLSALCADDLSPSPAPARPVFVEPLDAALLGDKSPKRTKR